MNYAALGGSVCETPCVSHIFPLTFRFFPCYNNIVIVPSERGLIV